MTIREAGATTPEQLATLADLLGIAPEFRAIDERVRPETPLAERLELIRDEIATYRNARDRAARIDEADHRAAISGLGYERSAAGKRLFAYEQACMKRYLWAIDQLEQLQPGASVPTPPPSSVAWEVPEGSASPPAPTEPDPHVEADPPADPAPAASRPSPTIETAAPTSAPNRPPAAPRNRRERRLAEAATRREARARRRAAAAS